MKNLIQEQDSFQDKKIEKNNHYYYFLIKMTQQSSNVQVLIKKFNDFSQTHYFKNHYQSESRKFLKYVKKTKKNYPVVHKNQAYRPVFRVINEEIDVNKLINYSNLLLECNKYTMKYIEESPCMDIDFAISSANMIINNYNKIIDNNNKILNFVDHKYMPNIEKKNIAIINMINYVMWYIQDRYN